MSIKEENSYIIKLTKVATGGIIWKKLFVKILQYSQENTCAEVPIEQSCTSKGLRLYLKKDSNTDVVPVNITKFLRSPVLKNICIRLLLKWL